MTTNQLRYWENRESIRSHQAQEQQRRNELEQQRHQFNRSNWHQALGNIAKFVSIGRIPTIAGPETNSAPQVILGGSGKVTITRG